MTETEKDQAARRGGEAAPSADDRKGDRLVDGRLDPDAQAPGHEGDKPFDPKENDPA